MVTVAGPSTTRAEERIVLAHVAWDTYERLLADDEGRRFPRFTYDRGVLEIMSPSPPHEEDALTLNLLIETVAAVIGVPIRRLGSTTYRRKDLERGFEPDASFYVRNEARMRVRRQVDLSVDPPPDLVLEMEVSRSVLDKLALLASMGVPEVWRSDGEQVAILVLTAGRYREATAGLAFPALTSEVVTRFLAQSRTMPSPNWFESVMMWAREQQAGHGAAG